jgi:hypothetical protein
MDHNVGVVVVSNVETRSESRKLSSVRAWTELIPMGAPN